MSSHRLNRISVFRGFLSEHVPSIVVRERRPELHQSQTSKAPPFHQKRPRHARTDCAKAVWRFGVSIRSVRRCVRARSRVSKFADRCGWVGWVLFGARVPRNGFGRRFSAFSSRFPRSPRRCLRLPYFARGGCSCSDPASQQAMPRCGSFRCVRIRKVRKPRRASERPLLTRPAGGTTCRKTELSDQIRPDRRPSGRAPPRCAPALR